MLHYHFKYNLIQHVLRLLVSIVKFAESSIVYATSVEHAEILRNRIEQGFRQIRETPGMIERVTRSMIRRVQACFQMQDGHSEYLL